MQLANPNPDDFSLNQQKDMDATLLVRFYVKAVQDKVATAKEGRPIFKDVEYVEIRTPGCRDPIARPAKPHDLERFPRHYEAFKNRTSQEVNDGTPLSEWPLIPRSQVEELAFFNVKTVEQLVAIPDSSAAKFMGINTLKAKAKSWLEASKEAAKASELKTELDKRDKELAELRAMVEELKAAKPPLRKKVGTKKVTRKKVSAKKE